MHLPSGTYFSFRTKTAPSALSVPPMSCTCWTRLKRPWRVTAPGGVLLLPTFLMGEAGPVMRVLIALYRLLGFRQKHMFTRRSYRAFLESLGLPVSELTVVPGRLPVGLAVLQKPEFPEGSI